jgi:hypothetical protein
LHSQLVQHALGYDLEAKFTHFLTELGWYDLHGQAVAIALAAQGINNYVGFPRMVVNLQVVVLNQLQPSALSHIQILLGEEVF